MGFAEILTPYTPRSRRGPVEFLGHIPLEIFSRISMTDEIIYCQYIERGDHEKIEEYKRKGWEISEFDNHHSAHAVLVVKGKFRG